MKTLKYSTCFSGTGNRNLGGAFVAEYNNEFFVGVHDETGKAFFIRKYETCLEAGLIFREVLDYCVNFYRKGAKRIFWLEETNNFILKESYAHITSKMVELGSENAKSERREIGEGANINPRIVEIMTQ